MYQKLKKHLLLLSLILAISVSFNIARAQVVEESRNLYFQVASSEIDPASDTSGVKSLLELFDILSANPSIEITSIEIESYASPEGDVRYNDRLSAARSASIVELLGERYSIDPAIITTHSNGIAWEMFREIIVAEGVMSTRGNNAAKTQGLLDIIDNVPIETWRKINPTDRYATLVDSRIKHLMDYDCGVPYRDMYKNIFPRLRMANLVTVYFKQTAAPISPEHTLAPVAAVADTNLIEQIASPAAIEPLRKPLFAVKTNLIYDVAITPNLEVEVPLGDRWSVGLQGLYGWWLARDNSFCWQIQAADLEGRYWFGDRSEQRLLTGWFAGAFASAGFYDFQLKKANGIQGEFYVMTGISGGYSMPLGENLYLEFAAGIGYLVNDYQEYRVAGGTYLIENGPRMRYQSLFPAKLEVSIGYLLFNRKKGGRQ